MRSGRENVPQTAPKRLQDLGRHRSPPEGQGQGAVAASESQRKIQTETSAPGMTTSSPCSLTLSDSAWHQITSGACSVYVPGVRGSKRTAPRSSVSTSPKTSGVLGSDMARVKRTPETPG